MGSTGTGDMRCEMGLEKRASRAEETGWEGTVTCAYLGKAQESTVPRALVGGGEKLEY